MTGKIKVKVKLTPLSGKPTTQTHEVPVTVSGTTIGAIAAQMGIDLTKRNIMLDGKPAIPESLVANSMKVEMTEIAVTERPQGS